ncbi:MAG TPA: hypothetical protein VIX35_08290 [Vicinamibacterales bacterium]
MRNRIPVVMLSVALIAPLFGTTMRGQTPNPRYGTWKLKSDAPAPSSNLMTYAPFNGTGMKITIDSVNASGAASQWYYTTMYDGKDEPITGNRGADTGSVRVINDKVNEIVYKKGGVVTQVLTNILSPDNDTIAVVYMRQNADGKTTSVTNATYERQK